MGNNSITGNRGAGIVAGGSSVRIGAPAFGLPITNVISGNGTTSFPNDGINAGLGAAFLIESAIITGNTGNGITLGLHSSARMYNDTVNGNTGNGILLQQGGGVVLENPVVTVTGNHQFGLQCSGPESSFSGNIGGISNVSPSCSEF